MYEPLCATIAPISSVAPQRSRVNSIILIKKLRVRRSSIIIIIIIITTPRDIVSACVCARVQYRCYRVYLLGLRDF